MSDSLQPHGHSPWNSPGQNTGVGGHFLLQGIFPTQGSKPGLSRCRQTLYRLSHEESPQSGFNWYSTLGGLTLKLEFIWSLPEEVFLSLARAQ